MEEILTKKALAKKARNATIEKLWIKYSKVGGHKTAIAEKIGSELQPNISYTTVLRVINKLKLLK